MRSSLQQLHVVKGLGSNLLGLPTIRALNLATRLEETTAESAPLTAVYIHQHYKKVFQGLGNLGVECEVRLEPGVKPFVLYTPRRVPLPLREKVSEELTKMEGMGVISWVDNPLVCRDGGSPKEVRRSPYLRRPQAPEPERSSGDSSSS